MDSDWGRVSDLLREKIGSQNVETWFQNAQFRGVADRRAVPQLPNKFFVDWIAENYNDVLLESFRSVCGDVAHVQLHVSPGLQGELFLEAADAGAPPPSDPGDPTPVLARRMGLRHGSLNEKYRFETFVVGASNQF